MERDHPYVWITWLKGLMSGDDQCEWQIWFKVHNQDYLKTPPDFDSVEWNLKHTRLLRETRYRWEKENWLTFVENQNSFKIKWPSDAESEAVVSGKPDLIARSADGSVGVIIDAKTGKPRTSDRVQVLLYMYLFPWAKGDETEFDGELQYLSHEDKVPASMLTTGFKDTFDFWMKIILQKREPDRIPSEMECNFCNIADCPVRFTE